MGEHTIEFPTKPLVIYLEIRPITMPVLSVTYESSLTKKSREMGYQEMKRNMKIYTYPYTHTLMPLAKEAYARLKPEYQMKAKRVQDNETQLHINATYAYIGIEANTMPFRSEGTFGAGGYLVRHLKNSHFVTKNPENATFFFMPIACEGMRYAARTRWGGGWLAETGTAVSVYNLQQYFFLNFIYNTVVYTQHGYVQFYVEQIKMLYPYWNRTQGADHFYICTHLGPSVAAQADPNLVTKAIAIICAGDLQNPYFIPQVYFHKLSYLKFDPN